MTPRTLWSTVVTGWLLPAAADGSGGGHHVICHIGGLRVGVFWVVTGRKRIDPEISGDVTWSSPLPLDHDRHA